jgi:hypothetical protein
MARRLMLLADRGEAASEDDGCAILFGMVRDCAYTIRGRAEREKARHVEMGMWDGEPDAGSPCRRSGGGEETGCSD